MVHALEITHGLLKRGGLFIDLHPNGSPPPVEVHMDGKVLLAGHLDETDGFAEYFQADSALADVTGKGLFALERAGQFPFVTHAPTTKALAGHLEAEWSDAVLTEDLIERLEELMAEPAEDREIVMRETIRIARYRSMGR